MSAWRARWVGRNLPGLGLGSDMGHLRWCAGLRQGEAASQVGEEPDDAALLLAGQPAPDLRRDRGGDGHNAHGPLLPYENTGYRDEPSSPPCGVRPIATYQSRSGPDGSQAADTGGVAAV